MVLESIILGIGVVAMVLLAMFVRSVGEISESLSGYVNRQIQEVNYQHVWDIVEKGVLVAAGHDRSMKLQKKEVTVSGKQYAITVISDVLLQHGFNLKEMKIDGMIDAMCERYRINL